MPRAIGITEAFNDYGVRYVVEPGFETRGKSNFTPKALTWHWTWTEPRGCSWACGPLLINGRSDLAGPLCNQSTDACGLVHLVASGYANHAGAGSWRGVSGNNNTWGDELEYRGGPWPEVQLESARLSAAAAADFFGFKSVMCHDHFEWTRRKRDRDNLDPNWERFAVEYLRRQHHDVPPAQPPADRPLEDDMDFVLQRIDNNACYAVSIQGGTCSVRWLPEMADINSLEALGWKRQLFSKNFFDRLVSTANVTDGV